MLPPGISGNSQDDTGGPLGNVWEWCRDWYGSYDLPVTPGDGERQVPEEGARYRVFRGGSFSYAAVYARSAFRSRYTPENRNNNLGLRPANVSHRQIMEVASDEEKIFLPCP